MLLRSLNEGLIKEEDGEEEQEEDFHEWRTAGMIKMLPFSSKPVNMEMCARVWECK